MVTVVQRGYARAPHAAWPTDKIKPYMPGADMGSPTIVAGERNLAMRLENETHELELIAKALR